MKRLLFYVKIFLSLNTILLLLTSVLRTQDSFGMRRVSMLEYWQGASDIQMVGDTAYIVSGASGLHIMNLSDPTNPIEIGRCSWFDQYYVVGGVDVVGNLQCTK